MSYQEMNSGNSDVNQEQQYDDDEVALSQDELDDVAGGWTEWNDAVEKGSAWEW